MGYYMMLSLQYMKKNPMRTFDSLCGIMLSFILVFAAITTGYSYLSYCLAVCYEEYGGEYQLQCFAENGKQITGEQVKALEADDAVRECKISGWSENDDVDSADQITEDTEGFDIYVGLKDTSDLEEAAKELNQKYHLEGSGSLSMIGDVALFLNQGDSLELSLMNTIIVLIGALFGVFSIVMLRNTMTISVVERMRDYGLLRCVGMSKKQLYMLLVTEGILLGLCGMAGAIGIGFALLKGLEGMINTALNLRVKFYFYLFGRAVVVSALLGFAVVLFSLIEPARQAGNISPVEALRRNVVLRTVRGRQRDRIRYHRAGIVGRLLGVPGEYAYKNMMRSRGHFVYIFCAVFVCEVFLGSVFSFSDSLYATVKQSYYGKNKLYPEGISLDEWKEAGVEEIEALADDINKLPGVERTQWNILFTYIGKGDEHLQSQERVTSMFQGGYDKETLNELKPYLLEGEINYQRMVDENGIILYDTYYNTGQYGEDGKVIFERITDYQVGDTITILTRSALEKADILWVKASQWSCSTKKWKYLADASMKGEEGFEKRCERMLQYLKKKGYDCTEIKDSAEYESTGDIRDAIQEYLYNHGEKETYTIQGIVSENVLVSEVYGVGYEPTICMFGPRENLMGSLNADGENSFNFLAFPQVGIKRKLDDMDGSIGSYCQEHYTEEKPLYYFSDMEEVAGMMKALRTVRFAVKVISIFILGVCLLQILNTVRAGMFLRRKELWLYRVVGMTSRQERRMIVIENSSAVILATVLGVLVSWGISWYIVSYLLDQLGMICYIYPFIKSLALAVFLTGLSILMCLWGSRSREHGS